MKFTLILVCLALLAAVALAQYRQGYIGEYRGGRGNYRGGFGGYSGERNYGRGHGGRGFGDHRRHHGGFSVYG
ncbi:unnamed protein product [Allacma fusca]|uniref:Uncharacterized protein n=1 Tax=Allacma fusca TaxID=39272 RepID=A0A8J2NND4_9HEXA|nr:unnamed protein product [Allacma fusca]